MPLNKSKTLPSPDKDGCLAIDGKRYCPEITDKQIDQSVKLMNGMMNSMLDNPKLIKFIKKLDEL